MVNPCKECIHSIKVKKTNKEKYSYYCNDSMRQYHCAVRSKFLKYKDNRKQYKKESEKNYE